MRCPHNEIIILTPLCSCHIVDLLAGLLVMERSVLPSKVSQKIHCYQRNNKYGFNMYLHNNVLYIHKPLSGWHSQMIKVNAVYFEPTFIKLLGNGCHIRSMLRNEFPYRCCKNPFACHWDILLLYVSKGFPVPSKQSTAYFLKDGNFLTKELIN
jgi:hypothetical protein